MGERHPAPPLRSRRRPCRDPRFVPPLRLLLLLMLPPRLLRAEREDDDVQALVGSNVTLPCVSPQRASFELHDLYVYWQIKAAGQLRTVAWYLGRSSSDQSGCKQRAGCEWRPGAELAQADMQRGDFTLRLANISLQDEQQFECLVFENMTKILERRVRLHVGASYSMPVVTAQEPAADGELVFTCTSSSGYPQPKVHWVNETDGSLLDASLHNSTVQLNAHGLYDVLSVLRLRRPGPARVRCCLENEVLRENVSSRQPEKSQSSSTTPRLPEGTSTYTPALLAMGVIALVGIAVATGWKCRKNWPPGGYTGVWEARQALKLSDLGEATAAQRD